MVSWLLPFVCIWLDCFLVIACCLVYCKSFKVVLGSFLHFAGLISWLSLFLLDSLFSGLVLKVAMENYLPLAQMFTIVKSPSTVAKDETKPKSFADALVNTRASVTLPPTRVLQSRRGLMFL